MILVPACFAKARLAFSTFHTVTSLTLTKGYFLLRESMLDSVLVARDKFLKPGGAMYPSHANMYMVAIQSHQSQQKLNEFHVSTWGNRRRQKLELVALSILRLPDDTPMTSSSDLKGILMDELN